MLYNPPSGSTDANAPYVGKNVAAGTQGSKVPPAAVEYPQREAVATIAASGQSPTNSVLVQMAMALARGVFVGNLTGTGDLAVATLGVVFPQLLQGMRIGGVATATNTVTNPKLRVINLGSVGGATEFPILKEDGSALAVGEIKAGRRYRYEADGAGNVMISGGGLGLTLALAKGFGQYNTPGTITITVPLGVTRMRGWIVGGGGSGGGSNGSGSGASGGGAGGLAEFVDVPVIPGETITLVVGAGAVTGGGSAAGLGGGTSTISSASLGAIASATGGGAGQINGGLGGASGIGSLAANIKGRTQYGGGGFTVGSNTPGVGGAGGGIRGTGGIPTQSGTAGAGFTPGSGGAGGYAFNAGGAGANGEGYVEFY